MLARATLRCFQCRAPLCSGLIRRRKARALANVRTPSICCVSALSCATDLLKSTGLGECSGVAHAHAQQCRQRQHCHMAEPRLNRNARLGFAAPVSTSPLCLITAILSQRSNATVQAWRACARLLCTCLREHRTG